MLILAIIVFGMLVGWLAQAVLGMGTRPNAQSLIAGLAGSFVGGLLASLIAGDGLKLRPSGLIGSSGRSSSCSSGTGSPRPNATSANVGRRPPAAPGSPAATIPRATRPTTRSTSRGPTS